MKPGPPVIGPVGDPRALPGESIFTFTDGLSGGKISLRRVDGMLRVEVYEADMDVDVVWSADDDPGVRL